jgi:hypothetical protein
LHNLGKAEMAKMQLQKKEKIEGNGEKEKSLGFQL